jgi:hypothetical protein
LGFDYINMKQRLVYLVFILLLSANANAQRSLYVSPNGKDSNPGTLKQPFATLQRAQAEARKYRNGSLTVWLRSGTYYLLNPVVFSNADSRAADEKLFIRPYLNERPVISSSKKLTLHWVPYQDGIWQADVPDKNIVFDELFINSKLQLMARYPNYHPGIRPYGGTAEDALSADRVKKWKHPEGGYIHSLHASEWGDLAYEITGKDSSGNLQMKGGYQNNRPSPLNKKIRYVENIKEELDTLNEWYFDKENHRLYCYPPVGIDLNKAAIETPQLESLFEFRGDAAKPVKNISIEGLELGQTLRTFMKNMEPLLRSDWTIYRGGTITIEGAEHCTIKDCYFNTVGGNAVVFSNYNRYDTVTGCRIINAGSSGIVFVGDSKAARSPLFRYEQSNNPDKIDTLKGPVTNNYPAECLVYDNLIEGIGRVEKQVAGVQISMSQDITISHNTIDNVPRAGININEGTWGGHIIEYNDVFNTVLETGDHGSFNSWGRDRYWYPNREMMDSLALKYPNRVLLDAVKPTIIRNNRFRCDHGWDIDLDDGSSNYEIYNNVCLNGGLKLREGFYRKVYNNIIISNSFHPHVWFKNSKDVFEHNIVSAAYFPIGITSWGSKVDYNFFPDSASLHKEQSRGTDEHALYGNPRFANVTTGDYTLPKNSPILKAGFKNFPLNKFGVVSPALKKLANKVIIPPYKIAQTQKAQQTYSFMGVTVKDLNTLSERSATGMDSERGVIVLNISDKSKLKGLIYPNDVILSVQNVAVQHINDLINALPVNSIPEKLTFGIFRNQKLNKIVFIQR